MTILFQQSCSNIKVQADTKEVAPWMRMKLPNLRMCMKTFISSRCIVTQKNILHCDCQRKAFLHSVTCSGEMSQDTAAEFARSIE
jgi:hypothetical protein